MSELKRTQLYDVHVAAGAEMVDFGGWEMPIQYPGGRLHLRWSGVTVRPFRSIVRNRSFCLRASAFPFGAAWAVSPDSIVRSI